MSEKNEAARDGAVLQPNSGRLWFAKGDAKLGELFLIDYKEYAKSFGVSIAVWSKATADALKEGRKPALKLVLGGKVRLWVIGDDIFHEMYEAWQEKYGTIDE